MAELSLGLLQAGHQSCFLTLNLHDPAHGHTWTEGFTAILYFIMYNSMAGDDEDDLLDVLFTSRGIIECFIMKSTKQVTVSKFQTWTKALSPGDSWTFDDYGLVTVSLPT